MAVCDCCRKEKPDAAVRPGLYPVNASGERAQQAYLRFLCDACLQAARQPGTRENSWLLAHVGLEE